MPDAASYAHPSLYLCTRTYNASPTPPPVPHRVRWRNRFHINHCYTVRRSRPFLPGLPMSRPFLPDLPVSRYPPERPYSASEQSLALYFHSRPAALHRSPVRPVLRSLRTQPPGLLYPPAPRLSAPPPMPALSHLRFQASVPPPSESPESAFRCFLVSIFSCPRSFV